MSMKIPTNVEIQMCVCVCVSIHHLIASWATGNQRCKGYSGRLKDDCPATSVHVMVRWVY